MSYLNPLDEYYAALNGALPAYQTPMDRMQQGLPAIPTAQEAAPSFIGQDTSAARAAMAPYLAPLPQETWNVLGGAYGFQPPQIGAGQPGQPEQPGQPADPYGPPPGMADAPPPETSTPTREPAGGLQPYAPSGRADPKLVGLYRQGQENAVKIAGQEQALFEKRSAMLELRQADETQRALAHQDEMAQLQANAKAKREAFNAPEAKVDTGRFFKEKSTSSLIGMGLSLAAGTLGAAIQSHGSRQPVRNGALDIILSAINRDLDLQEKDLTNARAQKKEAVVAADSLIGQAQQVFTDGRAARQFATSLALDTVANQAAALAATARNAETQTHYAEKEQMLRQQAEELAVEAEQRQFIRNQALKADARADKTLGLEERKVEMTTQKAQGEAAQKQKERYVPGWGLALEGEAKGLREATAAFEDINKAIDAQKTEYGKRGVVDYLAHDVGINTKTDQSLIDRRKELLVLKNKAAASGVLDANNERIFDELTGGNPTDPFNFNYEERLEQLRDSLRRNLEARLKTGLEQWEPGAMSRVNPQAANQQVMGRLQARPR